jgi:hypothetical protein
MSGIGRSSAVCLKEVRIVKQTKMEEEEEGMMLHSVNRMSSIIHLEGPKRAMDNLKVIILRVGFLN